MLIQSSSAIRAHDMVHAPCVAACCPGVVVLSLTFAHPCIHPYSGAAFRLFSIVQPQASNVMYCVFSRRPLEVHP